MGDSKECSDVRAQSLRGVHAHVCKRVSMCVCCSRKTMFQHKPWWSLWPLSDLSGLGKETKKQRWAERPRAGPEEDQEEEESSGRS